MKPRGSSTTLLAVSTVPFCAFLHRPSSGVGNQLGHTLDFEFVFDARAVSVHRLCTEMKLAGDLLGRESLANQLEDFKLTVGKPLDDGALGRRLPAGNSLQYPCRHLLADVEPNCRYRSSRTSLGSGSMMSGAFFT